MAREARKRSGQGKRYATERHIENLSYLAIAQAFGPQEKTPAILFRQGLDDGHEMPLSLAACQLILRIGTRVYGQGFRPRFHPRLRIPARPISPSQGQIVGDPE